jgi:hypothetical protein
MVNRVAKKGGVLPAHTKLDPVQKMHRNLAWALGTGTLVLVINAVAVVAVV